MSQDDTNFQNCPSHPPDMLIHPVAYHLVWMLLQAEGLCQHALGPYHSAESSPTQELQGGSSGASAGGSLARYSLTDGGGAGVGGSSVVDQSLCVSNVGSCLGGCFWSYL